MSKLTDIKKNIWNKIIKLNIKGYHLILVGTPFVAVGVYSIFKIKNSEWYSGRCLVLGILLIVMGIPLFIGDLKKK